MIAPEKLDDVLLRVQDLKRPEGVVVRYLPEGHAVNLNDLRRLTAKEILTPTSSS